MLRSGCANQGGGGIDLVFDMTLAPLADEPVPESSPKIQPEVEVLILGALGEDKIARRVAEHLSMRGFQVQTVYGFHTKHNSNITLYGETDTYEGRVLSACLRDEFGDRFHTNPTGKGSGFTVRVNQ